MAFANLLGQTFYVSVEHLNLDSGSTTKEGYVADLGLAAVACNIQPASAQVIALNNGAFGKAYTIYTTTSGILESDRLTTVSGCYTPAKVFIVKGKQEFSYGIAQHTELYIEETQ